MKTRFVATLAVATLSLFSSVAHADDDPSAVAAARTIGVEGLKLAEGGNCKDAIEKLDRAEKLHHAPTTLFKLGECNIKLGHLVLGSEHLRRLTRETLDPKAPPAFVTAQKNAQKLLDETTPKIAQLHVTVTLAAPGLQPQVTIDGEAVPPAMVDLDRPTDPGAHTVEATAQGYLKATQQVTLKEGEKKAITLTPEIDKNAVAATPPTPARLETPPQPPPEPPPPAPAPEPKSNSWRTVGWALVGVGAAGIATGLVAGALGLGTKSSLEDKCGASRNQCPADQQDGIDRLQTEATIGTIGFVVGGVGLVSGAAVLLFGSKPTSSPAASNGVSVGLGSLGYRGTF